MSRTTWIVAVLLLIIGWARPCSAIIPGGVYSNDESMPVTIDSRQWPHTLGYHVVRGTAVYHGRKILFVTGIFLPPAFFHTTAPMPVLVALHNRFAIGEGADAVAGEGMGRLLAYGGDDNRASGDKALNPITLRRDAQFIGVVPLCPAGFAGWESPAVTNMLCSCIAKVVSQYHADDDRVYLTGFSYGASSTWRVALLAPDRFAALIICDGRQTSDPIHDVEKLKNVAIYMSIGEWDGDFVTEGDRMHQALNTLPHRDYIFRIVYGGNHFCYEAVYDDPEVWKWVLAHRRKPVGNPNSESRIPE
jgi:pimeloyl-ACP methyl ester carboxylesterase